MKKFYNDETYIKMCEKSSEIQGLFIGGEEHQFIVGGTCRKIKTEDNGYYYGCCDKDDHGEKDIWLPRQDQLQAMLEKHNYHTGYIGKGDNKGEFYLGYENYYLHEPPIPPEEVKLRGESIEVLLLKMIMDIEYNKTWNGEDWV